MIQVQVSCMQSSEQSPTNSTGRMATTRPPGTWARRPEDRIGSVRVTRRMRRRNKPVSANEVEFEISTGY